MRESSMVPVCGSTAVTRNDWPSNVKLVAFFQLECGRDVGPSQGLVVLQIVDDPLANQRLLVTLGERQRGHRSAADGAREDAGPAHAALAWNSLLGRMPVSVNDWP